MDIEKKFLFGNCDGDYRFSIELFNNHTLTFIFESKDSKKKITYCLDNAEIKNLKDILNEVQPF